MSLSLENSIGGMFQTYKRDSKNEKYRVSSGVTSLLFRRLWLDNNLVSTVTYGTKNQHG
jgi:hypothetical protein